jgi:hypothetical protein
MCWRRECWALQRELCNPKLIRGVKIESWRAVKKLLILALFICPFAVSSIFQEAGYKDLVDLELRAAEAPIGGGSGSCGGASHEPPPTTSLDITLLSLDKSRYLMGDDVEFVVKVTNAGNQPVLLPWDPHGADFEEKAAGDDYRYVSISMLLELSDGREKELMTGWSLFGSPDVAGSLLELQPGNWVQVRAKSGLEIYSDNEFQHRLHSGPETDLKIKPSLLADNVTVSHREGKAYLDSQCLKWGITTAGEKTIHILPREVPIPPTVER